MVPSWLPRLTFFFCEPVFPWGVPQSMAFSSDPLLWWREAWPSGESFSALGHTQLTGQPTPPPSPNPAVKQTENGGDDVGKSKYVASYAIVNMELTQWRTFGESPFNHGLQSYACVYRMNLMIKIHWPCHEMLLYDCHPHNIPDIKTVWGCLRVLLRTSTKGHNFCGSTRDATV